MRVLTHFLLWNLGFAEAETQTTELERNCLARHASGKRRLAEIGVWHGVTTSRLRRVMHPAGTLVAIDPYPAGRLGFSAQKIIGNREVSKIFNGTVEWVRNKGDLAGQELTRNGSALFDFIFIDGDHTYDGLRADWEAWSRLTARGGIIALHDSRSTPIRVIDDAGSVCFTNDVVLKDARFQVVDIVDSLTVLQRLTLQNNDARTEGKVEGACELQQLTE